MIEPDKNLMPVIDLFPRVASSLAAAEVSRGDQRSDCVRKIQESWVKLGMVRDGRIATR